MGRFSNFNECAKLYKVDQLPRAMQNPNAGNAIEMINRCFSLYYNTYKAFDRKRSDAAGTPEYDFWYKLSKDATDALVKASKSGHHFWGNTGNMTQSLYDIFVELESQPKAAYPVIRNDAFNAVDYAGGQITVPLGIANFEAAMIDLGGIMQSKENALNTWATELKSIAVNKKWESLGPNIHAASVLVDQVSPYLWVSAFPMSKTFLDAKTTGAKWLDYGAKLKGWLDVIIKYEGTAKSGFTKFTEYVSHRGQPSSGGGGSAVKIPPETIAQIAAFALEKGAEKVPGIGTFIAAYAGVIKDVPKAMAFFASVVKDRNDWVEGRK